MRNNTRLIAAFLAVIMLISSAPISVFAVGLSSGSEVRVIENKTVTPPITDYDGLIIEFESAAYLEIYAQVNGGVKLGGNMMKIAGGYEDALKYGELSYVKSVTYNYIVTADEGYDYSSVPNDPSYASQTALIANQALTGWKTLYDFATEKAAENAEYSLSTVKIAVLDTGINGTHPDLVGRVIDGYDFINNTVALATVNSDSSAVKGSHHGTKVAGILAASANNSKGIAGAAGCFPVVMMPVCVLNERGSGTIANVISGIYWAMEHDANIINMSFGKRMTTFPTALSNAVKEAAAAGILIFAAGGNEKGKDVAGYYPACLDGVYPVLSYVDRGSGFYELSSFSNKVTDTKKYHFAAMGDNVPTTVGDAYGTFTGTSASTPIISGYAAAVLSVLGATDSRNSEQALAVLKASSTSVNEYGTGKSTLWKTVDFSKLTQSELANAYQKLNTALKPGFSFDGPQAGTLISGRQTMTIKVVTNPELVEKVVFYYDQTSGNRRQVIESFDRRADNTYTVTFDVLDLDVDYRYTFNLHAVIGMAGQTGVSNWYTNSNCIRVDLNNMERNRWEYVSGNNILLMKDADGGLVGNADIRVYDTETGEYLGYYTTDRNGVTDFSEYYEHRYYTFVAAFDGIFSVDTLDIEEYNGGSIYLGGNALRHRTLNASYGNTVLSRAKVYGEVLGNVVTVGTLDEDGMMDLSVSNGMHELWVVDNARGYVLHKTVILDDESDEISFASEIEGAVTVIPAPAEDIEAGNTLKLGFTDASSYKEKERVYFTVTGDSVKVSQGTYSVTAVVIFEGNNYVEIVVGNGMEITSDTSLSFDYLTINLFYATDKEVYGYNEEAVITRYYITDGGHRVLSAGVTDGEDHFDQLDGGFEGVEGWFKNGVFRINTSKLPLVNGVVTLVTSYVYPENFAAFGVTLQINDCNINRDLGNILTVDSAKNFNGANIPNFYSVQTGRPQVFHLVDDRYVALPRLDRNGYVPANTPDVFSLEGVAVGTELLVMGFVHYIIKVGGDWVSYDVLTYDTYTYGGGKSESFDVPFPTGLRTVTLNTDSENYHMSELHFTPKGKAGATYGLSQSRDATLRVAAGAYDYCVVLCEVDWDTDVCDFYLSEGTLGASETVINAGKAGLSKRDTVRVVADGSDEISWLVRTRFEVELNNSHITIGDSFLYIYPSGFETYFHYKSGTPSYKITPYMQDAYHMNGFDYVPTPTMKLSATKTTDLTPAEITAQVNVNPEPILRYAENEEQPIGGLIEGTPEKLFDTKVNFTLKDAYGSLVETYSYVDISANALVGKAEGAVYIGVYPTYDFYRSGIKIISGETVESYDTLDLGALEAGSYAVQLFFTLPDSTVISTEKMEFTVGEETNGNFAYITSSVTETKGRLFVTVSGMPGATVTIFYQHELGEPQSFTGFTVPENGSLEIPLSLDIEGMWYIWAEATLDEDVKKSEKLSVKRDTTAPAVPTFAFSVIDSDEMDLTVTMAPDAVRTYLFRDGKKIATLLSSGTVRENYLDGNRIYTYSAYSEDSVGNVSETVYQLMQTIPDTEVPTDPSHLTGTSNGCASVSLEWWGSLDNVMIGGYHIYRNGVLVGSAGKTKFTDTGLTLGTTYTYKVKAYDIAGNESGFSNTVSVTTKSTANIYAFEVITDRKPNGLLKSDTVSFRVLTAKASDGVAYGKVFVTYTDIYDVNVEKTAVIDLAGDSGDMRAEITITGLDSLLGFVTKIYTADDVMIDERNFYSSALPYRKGARLEIFFDKEQLGDYTDELLADCELELASKDGRNRTRIPVPSSGVAVFEDVEPTGYYTASLYLKNANGEFFKNSIWSEDVLMNTSGKTAVLTVTGDGSYATWSPTTAFIRVIGVKKNLEKIPLSLNLKANVNKGTLIDGEYVISEDGIITVNGKHNLIAAEGKESYSNFSTGFTLYCPDMDLFTPDGVTFFNVQESTSVTINIYKSGDNKVPLIQDVYFYEVKYQDVNVNVGVEVEGNGSIDGEEITVIVDGNPITAAVSGGYLPLGVVRVFDNQTIRIEGKTFTRNNTEYVIRDQVLTMQAARNGYKKIEVYLNTDQMNVHIDIPEEIRAVLPLTEDGLHYDLPFTYEAEKTKGRVYPDLNSNLIFEAKRGENYLSVSLKCEAKQGYFFEVGNGSYYRISSRNCTLEGTWKRIYVPNNNSHYSTLFVFDVTNAGQELCIYSGSPFKSFSLADSEVSGRRLVAFFAPSASYYGISYAEALQSYGLTATELDTTANFDPQIIPPVIEYYDNNIYSANLKDYAGEVVDYGYYYLFAKNGSECFYVGQSNSTTITDADYNKVNVQCFYKIPSAFTEFEILGSYAKVERLSRLMEMLEEEGDTWSKKSFTVTPEQMAKGGKAPVVSLPKLSIVTSWNVTFTDETGDPLTGVDRGYFVFGGENMTYVSSKAANNAQIKLTLGKTDPAEALSQIYVFYWGELNSKVINSLMGGYVFFVEYSDMVRQFTLESYKQQKNVSIQLAYNTSYEQEVTDIREINDSRSSKRITELSAVGYPNGIKVKFMLHAFDTVQLLVTAPKGSTDLTVKARSENALSPTVNGDGTITVPKGGGQYEISFVAPASLGDAKRVVKLSYRYGETAQSGWVFFEQCSFVGVSVVGNDTVNSAIFSQKSGSLSITQETLEEGIAQGLDYDGYWNVPIYDSVKGSIAYYSGYFVELSSVGGFDGLSVYVDGEPVVYKATLPVYPETAKSQRLSILNHNRTWTVNTGFTNLPIDGEHESAGAVTLHYDSFRTASTQLPRTSICSPYSVTLTVGSESYENPAMSQSFLEEVFDFTYAKGILFVPLPKPTIDGETHTIEFRKGSVTQYHQVKVLKDRAVWEYTEITQYGDYKTALGISLADYISIGFADGKHTWQEKNINRLGTTLEDVIAEKTQDIKVLRSYHAFTFKAKFDKPTEVENVYVYTGIYTDPFVPLSYNKDSGLWETTVILCGWPTSFTVVYNDAQTKYNKQYTDKNGRIYPSIDVRTKEEVIANEVKNSNTLPEGWSVREIAPPIEGLGVTLEKARKNKELYLDYIQNWTTKDYKNKKKVKARWKAMLDKNGILWFPAYEYTDAAGNKAVSFNYYSFKEKATTQNCGTIVVHNDNGSSLYSVGVAVDRNVVMTTTTGSPTMLLPYDITSMGELVSASGVPTEYQSAIDGFGALAGVYGDYAKSVGVNLYNLVSDAVFGENAIKPENLKWKDLNNISKMTGSADANAAATSAKLMQGGKILGGLSAGLTVASSLITAYNYTTETAPLIADTMTSEWASNMSTADYVAMEALMVMAVEVPAGIQLAAGVHPVAGLVQSGLTLAIDCFDAEDNVLNPTVRAQKISNLFKKGEEAKEAWKKSIEEEHLILEEQIETLQETIRLQKELLEKYKQLEDMDKLADELDVHEDDFDFTKEGEDDGEDYDGEDYDGEGYDFSEDDEDDGGSGEGYNFDDDEDEGGAGYDFDDDDPTVFNPDPQPGSGDEPNEPTPHTPPPASPNTPPPASPNTPPPVAPNTPPPVAPPAAPYGPNGPQKPKPTLYDPSGYIFEGVETNRLSGVTATIYYLDTETNEWVKWNSEDYDQGTNPKISDSEGKYGWDVLAGQWKVVFEKDGYYTTESVVLEVPPPHDDVNISMVSREAPRIFTITAEENGGGLTVCYDKPVRVEDVQGFLKVTFAGDVIDGTVTPMDAALTKFGNKQTSELQGLESGVNVATMFRFVPNLPMTPATAVIVTAEGGIRGYNGMETEEYVSEAIVIPGLLPISALGFANEAYTITKGSTLDLAGAVEKVGTVGTLVWESLDTEIATVSQSGVVTAVAEGSTLIRVTCGEITAFVSINVETTKHTLTIHYYFNGTENMARPDYTAELEVGEAYSIVSAEKPKYAYDTERVEGIMGNEDVEITVYYDVALPIFTNISISLGSDITAYYYVSDSVYEDIQVRFALNGYTKTVSGTKVGNEYVFAFDGVAPQWIGDSITAELILNGDVVETKVYALTTYLTNLKNATSEELGMSEEKFGKMTVLINDLLIYCGAAQTYKNHNVENLVSADIEGSEFVNLGETDKSFENNGAYVTFSGMTVFFDSANKLMFRFTAEDLTGVTLKIKVGDGEETEIGYVKDGDYYIITTERIKAVGFDNVYTITAYKNNVAGATVTYSVKSYVYTKQGSNSAMAELAKATYNYGLSAKAFVLAE